MDEKLKNVQNSPSPEDDALFIEGLEEKIVNTPSFGVNLFQQEHEQKQEKPPEKKKSKIGRLSKIILILIVLAIIGFGAYLVFEVRSIFNNQGSESTSQKSKSETAMIKVPDLTGLTEDDALEELGGMKLGIKREKSIASEEEMGTVLTQDPVAGTMVDEYTTILVTVSEGAVENRMPDLTGEDTNGAYKILRGMQITNIKTEKVYGDSSFDKVIEVSPTPGTMIKTGQEIVLKISAGSIRTTADVDRYIGNDEGEALESARADKLIPIVNYAYSDAWERGTVFMQSVDRNAPVMAGTEVQLYVSNGPLPDETMYQETKKVSLEIPETATGTTYKIIAEESNEETRCELCLEEGDSAPLFPHKIEVPIVRTMTSCTLRYYEKETATGDYVPRASWDVISSNQAEKQTDNLVQNDTDTTKGGVET